MGRQARPRKQKLPTEPVTVSVQRLSHDGRGIASVEGKVAFVAGALPGETVVARYVSRRAQFDELDTVSVLAASPDRVAPTCAVFERCGGCSMQHLANAAQVGYKSNTLQELLQRSLGESPATWTVLPSLVGDSYHYRRKARLAVRYVAGKGGTLVGFREKHGSFITVTESCPVLAQPVADLILPLRQLLDRLAARQQIPQIEIAVGETATGAPDPALVLRHLQPLSPQDQMLLEQFGREHGVQWYLQPDGPDSIHKLWPTASPARLRYYLPRENLALEFHPVDFTQINASINRQAVALALDLLAPAADERVLDLFCGLGNFTLPLARHCREVVGVEGDAEMVLRARENAALNGIGNASFQVADLTRSFVAEQWAAAGFQKVLLDPPRSGAKEIVPLIAELSPVRIVYISCNPATLARDAALFRDCGYHLCQAGVMDMFPHTAHVESIAVFEPASGR